MRRVHREGALVEGGWAKDLERPRTELSPARSLRRLTSPPHPPRVQSVRPTSGVSHRLSCGVHSNEQTSEQCGRERRVRKSSRLALCSARERFGIAFGQVASSLFDLADTILHIEVVAVPPLSVSTQDERLALLIVMLDLPRLAVHQPRKRTGRFVGVREQGEQVVRRRFDKPFP